MTYDEFSARDEREARWAELEERREKMERFLPPFSAQQYDQGRLDRRYRLAVPQQPKCRWYMRGWCDEAKESV